MTSKEVKEHTVRVFTAAARGEITPEEAAQMMPHSNDLLDLIFINVLCTSAYIMLFVILEKLLK